MPETNQTNGSDQEETNGSNPTPVTDKENAENNVGKTTQADEKAKEKEQRIKWRRPIINVHPPQQDDAAMLKETRRGNRIALWAAIFSAAATVATLITLIYVKKSTDAAIAAANAANSANAYNREKDSLDNIRDTANDRINREHFDSTFATQSKALAQTEEGLMLQSKLVESQIKSIDIATNSLRLSQLSLKEERKKFELLNQTYLFLDSVGYDTIRPSRPIVVHIVIRNFGNAPAFTESYYAYPSFGGPKPKYDDSTNNIHELTWYITPNAPLRMPITLPAMSHIIYDDFVKERGFLVIYGWIKYYDMLTQKIMAFQYSFRLYPHDSKRISLTKEHNRTVQLQQ